MRTRRSGRRGVEATGPADCGVSSAEVESGIVDYVITPRIMEQLNEGSSEL